MGNPVMKPQGFDVFDVVVFLMIMFVAIKVPRAPLKPLFGKLDFVKDLSKADAED